MSTCCCCDCCVSAGRLMSRPFCESGRAAMKMTSSTSSTSIIGVMFMSPDTSSFLPMNTVSAPKCLWAAMSVASRLAGPLLRIGDEAHVLDPRRPQLIHRLHHRAVLRVLVGLDEHDALALALEDVL